MKQYIYFEDKTEYIIHGNKVENYPIGKLMFSLLDVDWLMFETQAEELLDKIKNGAEKPYFLVAELYQKQSSILQAVHPHLYRLLDSHLSAAVEDEYREELPVAHDFALRLFRHYPNESITPETFNEIMNGVEPALPDWPLIMIANGFVEEIIKLYHALEQCQTDLQKMITFALDEMGEYSELSARQRYYLMQISDFESFVRAKDLYKNIHIERRILNETELDYGRSGEITLELISQVQNYDLDAYSFYTSTDVRALIIMEFEFMCTHELTIRKCENCGRYFLPFSKVSLFCDRPVEGTDKTCKEIGATIKYNQKVNADQARSLFRRYNNAYQMRSSRAPMIYKYKDYVAWRENARKLLEQIEKGALSVSEFEEQIQLPKIK